MPSAIVGRYVISCSRSLSLLLSSPPSPTKPSLPPATTNDDDQQIARPPHHKMADDDSSDLSSLSSLSDPPSGDESDIQLERQHGILKFFHKVDKNPALEPKETTPPRPKREPSPPHEYVLADNPDIAVRVCALFRVVAPR